MCRAYRSSSSSERLTVPSSRSPRRRGSFRQAPDLAEARLEHRRRHQLRDPLAPPDLERLAAEIGEDHLHLAAIIVVDRAGRVEAGDAVLEREARARPHLHFIALGNGDRETGRDGVPLARRKASGPRQRRHRAPPRRRSHKLERANLRHAATIAAGYRSFGLLPRRLAAALLLGRPLRRALIDQAHGFVQRDRFGSAPLGSVAWVVPSLT